jgi:GTP pyrophosphokinase
LTTEDKKLIRKAFDVSVETHKDQRRKSGEAYIFHPLLWQNRCFRNWFGRYLYCSCILHDVVEDTPTTIQDIERLFNQRLPNSLKD